MNINFLRTINKEDTIHEGKYSKQQNGVVCFCEIISNDTNGRVSKVRCIADQSHPMADKTIDRVRTIQPFATSDGDEIYAAPPIGSQGILIIIESTPFLLGFYNPDETGRNINDPEAPPLHNRQVLSTGDFMFYNAFQSRILVRNFGLIEIQSTASLKTVYVPDRDILDVTCQNYHFLSNGGSTQWETNDTNKDTLLTVITQDNLEPTNILRFDVGQNENEVMFDAKMGPPNDSIDVDADATVYRNTIKDDGDWTMTVTKKASMNITPAGDWTSLFEGAFGEMITGTYDSESGKSRTLKTGGALDITAADNTTVKCVNMDIKTTGVGTLGVGAVEPVVLGIQLQTLLLQMVATFNSHQHMYVAPLFPVGPSMTTPSTGPMVPPTPAILSKKWTVE